MIQLGFHGAAETVTGSNYLVKTPTCSFIVDCGMFQGPDVESRNLEDYDYDASKVDFILLTHAHIDHSGMLPKLIKAGFKGKIYATNHTIQISTLLLLDSAKIQENNYKRGEPYGKYTNKVALVYNNRDAEETISMFSAVDYNDEFLPHPDVKVRFIRAGHILGAVSMDIEIKDGNETKNIIFSGDIGRLNKSLIETFDTDYQKHPDYILLESLYGGEIHPDRQQNIDQMMDIINETIKAGGNVLIPCFAVQRTQEILHDLKIAKDNGVLDMELPVYLDSPLAQKVTFLYTTALQTEADGLFNFKNLRYIRKYAQSLELSKGGGKVILAGSGMADGGRIVEHLTRSLGNRKNTVLFVGYQAEGTLGRALVEGNKEVEIGKTKFAVRAKIHYFHGFSAHGDTNDYLAWIKRFNSDKLKKVFMVHAEHARAEALTHELGAIGIENTHIPGWKEVVDL